MVNPIRLLKIYGSANRLYQLFAAATASYERTHDVSKSLFASKTFWFNVVTAAVSLTGVLPIPAETATIIVGVGNVLIRLLTNQPVHVATPGDRL